MTASGHGKKLPYLVLRPEEQILLRCCVCGGWRKRSTMGRRARDFAAHLLSARHTERNRKRGPQQKTLDRHAGRL